MPQWEDNPTIATVICWRKAQKVFRMDQFDNGRLKISETKIDEDLRTEIADKLLELLRQKKDSITATEEMLLGQAITGLSINVNSIYQPTVAGLKDCLSALRKLMAPRRKIIDANSQSDDAGEFLSYGVLVAVVEKIKKQINQA